MNPAVAGFAVVAPKVNGELLAVVAVEVPKVMLPPGAAGFRFELEMFPKLKPEFVVDVVVAVLLAEPNGVGFCTGAGPDPNGLAVFALAGVAPALNAKLEDGVALLLVPNANALVVAAVGTVPAPKAGVVLVVDFAPAPNINGDPLLVVDGAVPIPNAGVALVAEVVLAPKLKEVLLVVVVVPAPKAVVAVAPAPNANGVDAFAVVVLVVGAGAVEPNIKGVADGC